jgi:nicotinic acid phosphoribosyltransferase
MWIKAFNTLDVDPKKLDDILRERSIPLGDKLYSDFVSKEEFKFLRAMFEDGCPKFPFSASWYVDTYKPFMFPVMDAFCETNDTYVTIALDIRPPSGKNFDIMDNMNTSGKLRGDIFSKLKSLKSRKFGKEEIDFALQDPKFENFKKYFEGDNFIGKPLVDEVVWHKFTPNDENKDKVTVSFFESNGRWHIEVYGPWNRATFLETILMQVVYESVLRYDLAIREISYEEWLERTLRSTAYSVAYTMLLNTVTGKKITPALFAGRRTGSAEGLLLINYFLATYFNLDPENIDDRKTMDLVNEFSLNDGPVQDHVEYSKKFSCLGTSSFYCSYLLNKHGLKYLAPVGTHAHEMQMVPSAMYSYLDEDGLPFSQVLGHMIWRELVQKIIPGQKMTILPDVISTKGLLKAFFLTLDINGSRFIECLEGGIARQDSGQMEDFIRNILGAGLNSMILMASEISTTRDLLDAFRLGYHTFGAGGFFGDSEKVWFGGSSYSMAAKVIQVEYNDPRNPESRLVGYPTKLGDPKSYGDNSIQGKLSLSAHLDAETRAQVVEVLTKMRIRSNLEEDLSGLLTNQEVLDAFNAFFQLLEQTKRGV